MENITKSFGTLYHPKSALLFYFKKGEKEIAYVEHFDIDRNGTPLNAHPLTVREAEALAKSLKVDGKKNEPLTLKPSGVLDKHILYFDTVECSALWYTDKMSRQMYFSENMGIPSGKANVPAMLWYADRSKLSVFAVINGSRPTQDTKLCYAPFFNVYENGTVCMGTVDVNVGETTSLEEFCATWENYFFDSYFSHLVGGYNPINGNCVALWEELVRTKNEFPKQALKKNGRTLKDLLP